MSTTDQTYSPTNKEPAATKKDHYQQLPPIDGVPQQSERIQPGNDEFMTGLCKGGAPCIDACCCYWCQISRQYNVIFNETKGLNCGICCVLATFDLCVLSMASAICQCYIRDRLRKRYNMKEDCCCDCCTVFWCACCALSQTHWEMALRGDNPGATCGEANVPSQPSQMR